MEYPRDRRGEHCGDRRRDRGRIPVATSEAVRNQRILILPGPWASLVDASHSAATEIDMMIAIVGCSLMLISMVGSR
jgi:hypothetical protein